LMQGVIGLPIALGISYAIGALGVDRPVDPAIDQLSALIGASQMLGFPLAIFLFATRRYLLVPYVLSSVVAMHFVLYSWLYQTPFYIVMAVVIVVGGLVMMSLADRRSDVSAGTA